ncbi:putative benzyl alcohol O-benzoyltransferase [Helianthus anomalus]
MAHVSRQSLTFVVKRHAPELIAPSTPTPREVRLLSDIDDQAGLRHLIPVIQFYPKNPIMGNTNPASVIRDALAKVLVFYYPLAGRIREGPGRKLMVDCTCEGVVFIEAEADVRDELGPVRYRTGTGTERTGTENPQKWVPVPVPNIPGSVRFGTGTGSVPVFEGKNEQNTGPNRYRTGPVPNRYRKCQKWVPNRYRIGTRFGKFGTGTGSVPVPGPFCSSLADVTLEQFGKPLHPPFPCLENLFCDLSGSGSVVGSPLVQIQVMLFFCKFLLFHFIFEPKISFV